MLSAPPWRKRRPNRPRRPWLVSLVISTRLNSPVTTVVFAGELAQLTPTSRQAKLAVIVLALGLDVPAPVRDGAEREPLRGDIPQARTVLCARNVSNMSEYLSSTGIKNHPVCSGMFTYPPYIPLRHRRAGSCAPIDRLHSAYGSWVFVSTSLVQELICPCNDYDIVGRREPA